MSVHEDLLAALSATRPDKLTDARRRDLLRAAEQESYAAAPALEQRTLEDFELPNALGDPVRLAFEAGRPPLVILTYRGRWSAGDCERLRQLGRWSTSLSGNEARWLVIAPLTPAQCLIDVEEAGIGVEILADVGALVSRRLARTVTLTAAGLWALRALGIDPIRAYGLTQPHLPEAALLVVTSERRIVYRAGLRRTGFEEVDLLELAATLSIG